MSRSLFALLSICILISGLIYFPESFGSAEAENPLGTKPHVFKFYLDPTLVPDIEFAKKVLPKYVDDMNLVLAKNTPRQLEFDPETGIILTSEKPYTGLATPPLPTEDFEIWAHIVPSDWIRSCCGFASIDTSGAGVLAGLKWLQLYDPDTLEPNSDEMQDYWIQINHMLHELAHVHGAGVSEYYSLFTVDDTTGVEPIADINLLSNPDDPYWENKQDFLTDPLLQNIYGKPEVGNPTSRDSLLQTAKFSDLTGAILSASYRSGSQIAELPDMDNIKIVVQDGESNPVNNAQIKIWNIRSFPPYVNQLLIDDYSDENGILNFVWGGVGSEHGNYNHLRLIKVYKDGYLPATKHVSVFDAEIERILNGNNQWVVNMGLESDGSIPPPLLYCDNLTLEDLISDENYNLIDNRDGMLGSVITGTRNNDLILASDAGNTIYGKKGNDCIVGGDGNDFVYGQRGNDQVFGLGGDDVLKGNAGADIIFGGEGNDKVIGGKGDDQLSGNVGNDELRGGRGMDTCITDVEDLIPTRSCEQ